MPQQDRQRLQTIIERFLVHNPQIASLPLWEQANCLVEYFPGIVFDVKDFASEDYPKVRYNPLHCGDTSGGFVIEVHSI